MTKPYPAGGFEDLVRQQRAKEYEFYGDGRNKQNLKFKTMMQPIWDAVNEMLAEMGLPVVKPGDYE